MIFLMRPLQQCLLLSVFQDFVKVKLTMFLNFRPWSLLSVEECILMSQTGAGDAIRQSKLQQVVWYGVVCTITRLEIDCSYRIVF